MKAQIEFELQPFAVPENVIAIPQRGVTVKRRVEKGDGLHLTMKLCELDYATLSQMCLEFRASVFAKANMTDHAPDRKPSHEDIKRFLGPIHGGGRN